MKKGRCFFLSTINFFVLFFRLARFFFLEMGLLPLEFTECLTDSPYFRENLHAHERELEKTSLAIKSLIKEVKDLVSAARGNTTQPPPPTSFFFPTDSDDCGHPVCHFSLVDLKKPTSNADARSYLLADELEDFFFVQVEDCRESADKKGKKNGPRLESSDNKRSGKWNRKRSQLDWKTTSNDEQHWWLRKIASLGHLAVINICWNHQWNVVKHGFDPFWK